MSDVPLSTSRRVKICFFQHIISPKKPILHKKRKSTGVGAVLQSVNSLFYCKNLGNSTGFETFPNVKILTLLKEKTKLLIFHPLLSESPWKEQYEKSKNQCMHGRGCKHGASCRGTGGGGLG